MTYVSAIALLAILLLVLTRDVLTSLGGCVSVVGWWGWPFWVLGRAQSASLLVAVVFSIISPLSISLVLGILFSEFKRLGLNSVVYASIVAYYIAGTIYYALSGEVPDANLVVILLIWLLLVAVGVVISSRVLEKREKSKITNMK